MKWIALAAVALVAIGGGAYLYLTRTTADVELYGMIGRRAWDGAREVDELSFDGDRFRGNGATATMPADAEGVIVHLFLVTNCRRARGLELRHLELATDGHPALVKGSEEPIPYAQDALDGYGYVRFEGC